MKDQRLFDAWLAHARETLRLSKAAECPGDFRQLDTRDDAGQRLWDACLADGWTCEEGLAALQARE